MGAYIINVPDTVDTIIYVNIGDVYDGKTYIASQRVEDLTPYTEPDMERVRSCNRGHKSFCFQCGEEDCEKYQPNPPEWIEKLREDDDLMQLLEKMKEANNG